MQKAYPQVLWRYYAVFEVWSGAANYRRLNGGQTCSGEGRHETVRHGEEQGAEICMCDPNDRNLCKNTMRSRSTSGGGPRKKKTEMALTISGEAAIERERR